MKTWLMMVVALAVAGCPGPSAPETPPPPPACREEAWPVAESGRCGWPGPIELSWAPAGTTPASLSVTDDGDWTRGVVICRCPRVAP